ncbi:CCA tRNA nucleotidyltransferase [Candidatus Babeliales bacterium]|nr:CCA tRNA nucleotidyltransferase [Candidatus Babeliales bacterium]
MRVQLKEMLSKYKLVPILKSIIKAGGTPYLVGGTVRDLILGLDVKDIDIEVHGILLEELEKILKKIGIVHLVGKQFGVLRIKSLDIDWSLPRRDSKGRKPKVEIDPNMDIKEACRRRDLTINAMAINLSLFLTKNIFKITDPYCGLNDIKNKKLKVVDEKLFFEDPLRFYRVIQFVSRFGMRPDAQLKNICKKIDIREVAKERIYDEFKKMLLKSKRPSLGIRYLKEIVRLEDIMPEVYALIGVDQPPKYHPEGDVFEHTMQALDAAAMLDVYEDDYQKIIIMLGVLCHDFGKTLVTDRFLRARGHEKEGVALSKKFLKRFTGDIFLIKAVQKLVLHHLAPFGFLDQDAKLGAYRRLAKKLSPELVPKDLGLVALCDRRGRNAKSSKPLKEGKELFDFYMDKVKEAQVEEGAPKPVLLGRHLLDIVDPGKKMGELLRRAYELQIEEGIVDPEELKRRVMKYYSDIEK